MRMLVDVSGIDVRPVDELGWNGDALEAQGFAYMAVRTLRHLPISFPGTTGVPQAMCGVIICKCRSEEHTSELQSLMRSSYAVFCLPKNTRHCTPFNCLT